MYLDPGLGGMLVQIIVALVAAVGAFAFAMRKKLRSLFSKEDSANKEQAAPTELNMDSLEDGVVDTLSED